MFSKENQSENSGYPTLRQISPDVVAVADGEPKTAPLESAELPIGVMKGGVAVHWDSDTGVLTGNRIT